VLSCATSTVSIRDIDTAVNQTDFPAAVRVIEISQAGKRPLYNERNAISLFLDIGLLEHYAGNYAASSRHLQNAERLIEEAYTKSITQGFATFIVNDNMRDYPGEDFEDIYINVFNALNYYKRGDIEGALVEIRKLTISSGKLNMLPQRHNFTDPNTGESLSEITYRETGVSDLPSTKPVEFSNSALARYLSALFYQANRDFDSARIEFDQVHHAYRTNRNIYRGPVPNAVEEARNVPNDMARLNLISFSGLSPIKEEQRFSFPFILSGNSSNISLRLPVLVRRPNMITRVEVVVGNTGAFDLELIEDISAVVQETYNARFNSILLKTYIRTLMKHVGAGIATTLITGDDESSGREALGIATAIASMIAIEVSERADTRMARFLPGKAFIGGINLNPGTYSVTVNYYNGNRIVYRDVHNNVIVNQRGLNLLQSVKLN